MPSLGDLLTVLLLLVAGIFVWAALSPFETLGWWAGWFGDTIYDDFTPPAPSPAHAETSTDSYILFFSGVGRATGETLAYRERDFLQRLDAALPSTTIIENVFPYAVNNLELTNAPVLARFWRIALRSKARGLALAGYFINIRNIFQTMVSADRRYGPLFNQGVAEVIMHLLMRYGYDPERPKPVFVIGYSGAGQIALGACYYLKEWLHAPVIVISLGGVFASDPALLRVDQLYHLVGTKDRVEKVSIIAPGRWRLFPTSEWNRALRQGRVTVVDMGPMDHTGRMGYLDAKTTLPDGTRYIDYTVGIVADIVRQHKQAFAGALPPADLLDNGTAARATHMAREAALAAGLPVSPPVAPAGAQAAAPTPAQPAEGGQRSGRNLT